MLPEQFGGHSVRHSEVVEFLRSDLAQFEQQRGQVPPRSQPLLQEAHRLGTDEGYGAEHSSVR